MRLVLKWGDIETALVSTLTRPESRVRLHIRDISLVVHRVSTLTRPESRVRRSRKRLFRQIHEFQPSPDPKAGCDYLASVLDMPEPRVSTLTRPESRVRHSSHGASLSIPSCFNPHPTRKPGATLRAMRGGVASIDVAVGADLYLHLLKLVAE